MQFVTLLRFFQPMKLFQHYTIYILINFGGGLKTTMHYCLPGVLKINPEFQISWHFLNILNLLRCKNDKFKKFDAFKSKFSNFKVRYFRFKRVKIDKFIIHAPKDIQNNQEMPKNPKFRIYFKYP